MTERLLTGGWTVTDLDSGEAHDVSLPHDAMISRVRAADAPSSYHGAYFPGGRYSYRRTLSASELTADRHRLRFEGLGGAASVRVNGHELAYVRSRYRDVVVALDGAVDPQAENVLEIELDDSAQPNSRWYTGSGLYRPVWIDATGPARFVEDGVRIVTAGVEDGVARLIISVAAEYDGTPPTVRVLVRSGADDVAKMEGPLGEVVLLIPSARLWSAEHPHLYDIEVALVQGGAVSDVRNERFGVRTVHVDASRGLEVNGERVLLRGACIHHDSGVLGAATFRAFEYRRARILKQNGYNAVRSSHNPLSRDMLDACDEVGLYVVDELTDVWFGRKTAHDESPGFEETWPDDLRSMIAKDRNRASVIMYSLGNENGETATGAGVDAARRMSTVATELDATRPTTLAINFLLNVMASRGASVFDREAASGTTATPSAATSTIANVIADKIGAITGFIARLPVADASSRRAFDAVDVAGYNYGWTRYRGDARRHPQRVILGTETMPGDIATIWPLVESLPHVIGDFMWTGWDYLGETGLGDWAYGPEHVPLTKPYPQITAGTGAIDITGVPGVASLLARAVWGDLEAPAIAVRPLDKVGMKVRRSAWRRSDAVASWSWRGAEGRRAEIEVYSAEDEVELLLNGLSLGRRRAGARRGYVARFTADYEEGELVAVSYRDGRETGRSTLRSASVAALDITVEAAAHRADEHELAFVSVELRDEAGNIEMLDDDDVHLEISGPATLAGFGSAAPANPQPYTGDAHRTFRGRALAILRSTGAPGTVTVRATSKRHGQAMVDLHFGE